MPQYRDALGNFVDTPPGNAHKSSSLDPFPKVTSTPNGSGVNITDFQVTQNGQYMACISNPA